MRLSFFRFLFFYMGLVVAGSISCVVFANVGILNQILMALLTLVAFAFISLAIFVLTTRISKRLSNRVTKATSEELQREDDVLLQGVAFSQTILFVAVNLTLEEQRSRIIFSTLIAAFAITFYALRAWAKIKDSSKYRYYSMVVFALICGSTVFSSLMTVSILMFTPLFETPFSPYEFLVYVIGSGVTTSIMEIVATVFKKRYGYEGRYP